MNDSRPIFSRAATSGASPFSNSSTGGLVVVQGENHWTYYAGGLVVLLLVGLCVFTSNTATCDQPQSLAQSVTNFVQDTKAATTCMFKSVVGSSDYGETCPVGKQCKQSTPSGTSSVTTPVTMAPWTSSNSKASMQQHGTRKDIALHDMLTTGAQGYSGQKFQQKFGQGLHHAMSHSVLTPNSHSCGYNGQSCSDEDPTHHLRNSVVGSGFQTYEHAQVIGPQTNFSLKDAYKSNTGNHNEALAFASVNRLYQAAARNNHVVSPL